MSDVEDVREVGTTAYLCLDDTPENAELDEPTQCAVLLRRLADWLDAQQAGDDTVLGVVLAVSVVHCDGSPLALIATVE